jgi:hypothetical protein
LSLRGTEPPPSVPESFGPEQQRRNLVPLIVGAVVVAVVATVGFLAVSGRLPLPFAGKPTTTQDDPVWHWAITIPKAWDTKARGAVGGATGIRFESEGDNVGVRVQAEPLTGVVTPAETRSSQITSVLTKDEGPDPTGRPDATILSGPTFGTINGAPYVHYLVSYTDFSSGVPVKLEDSDYYLFNGANLEIVTFETDAKSFAGKAPDFQKAIDTFHSKYLSEGVPAPTPTGVTSTATTSPSSTATTSPSPAASAGASPAPGASASP